MSEADNAPTPRVAGKAISFCVTCRNRKWQLEQVLAHNLASLDEDCEIVLVDYGSEDGLSDWVWANFRTAIDRKQLVYFQVTIPVRWNVARAKNLAHRLANGDYLFNLDGDNYLTVEDLRLIRAAHARNVPSHQWTNVFGDGSFGRIGLPRAMFFNLGGYDESMFPMGGQDLDLVRRMRFRCDEPPGIGPPSREAVPNEIGHKVAEVTADRVDPQDIYRVINRLNLDRARLRLQIEGPRLTDGYATYRGLLNGEPIIIDGLNEIRPG